MNEAQMLSVLELLLELTEPVRCAPNMDRAPTVLEIRERIQKRLRKTNWRL